MPTVADLIEQSANQNSIASSAIDLLLQSYSGLAGEERNQQAALQSAGDASGVINTQQAQGALEAQTASRTAARAFGTDVNDAAQIVTGLAQELNAYFNQARASAAKIDAAEAQAQNNPVAELINMVTLPQEYGNYNSAVDQYNLIASHLEEVNQLTQAQAKTQADIAPTVTVATVAAVSQLAKAKADAEVSKSRQQEILYNVQGTKEVVQMGQTELSNSYTAFQAEEAQKSRELQRQQVELAMSERLERLQVKQDDEASNEATANYVRQGFASLYGDKAPNLPTRTILKGILQQNSQYLTAMNIGMNRELTGNTIISDNPGTAAAIIIRTNAPLTPEMKGVKDLLVQSAAAASEGKGATGVVVPKTLDITKQDQVIALTAENARAVAKQQLSKIAPNDFSNIYLAPSAKSIAALRGIQSDPFFQKVLKTQIENGMTESDPDKILGLAAVAVGDGTIKVNEAARGISLFFTGAYKLNNQIKDYKRVGLPEQTSYMAPVSYQGGFYANLDMSSRTDVAKILAARLIEDGFRRQVERLNATKN